MCRSSAFTYDHWIDLTPKYISLNFKLFIQILWGHLVFYAVLFNNTMRGNELLSRRFHLSSHAKITYWRASVLKAFVTFAHVKYSVYWLWCLLHGETVETYATLCLGI